MSVYITGLLLEINRSKSATVMVNNNFPIDLPFNSLFSFLNSPSLINIWSCWGWLLVPYFNKHHTCSFTNLVVSKISFPSIFQHWIDLYSWIKKDNTYSGSMSRLTLMFWPTSLLLYTLHECLINIANVEIELCNQSSSISTWPVRFQYFWILVSPCFFTASRSASLIA